MIYGRPVMFSIDRAPKPSYLRSGTKQTDSDQWRRYTRARQMTWLEDPPLWLRPAYCFRPLYLFYFDSETISGVGGLCFEGDD